MKKGTVLLAILTLVAVCSIIAILFLIRSAPQYETVEMSFSGMFIDGITGETQPITFTLEAEIYEDEILASFTAPENNEWKFFNSADPGNISKALDVPYIVAPCYFYNKQSKQIDFGDFALSLDKKIIAIRWAHKPYHMIYGSVNGHYTLEEMQEYFAVFHRDFGN